jgi:hypothetical protein
MSTVISRRTQLLGQADRLLGRTATAVAVATGAGLLGITPTAQAAIVYSGTVNIPIPATTAGVYLNMVTGVNNTVPASAPGWDVNPFSSTGFSWFAATPGASHGTVINAAGGTSATLVDYLPVGFVVDGTLTFGANNASETTGPTAATLNSSNNYVGVRFLNEGTTQINFGWVQVALGATLNDPARAIVGYAYEDTGAPITVTPVPEPSSMALLSVGAAGLVAYRRRRQAAKA